MILQVTFVCVPQKKAFHIYFTLTCDASLYKPVNKINAVIASPSILHCALALDNVIFSFYIVSGEDYLALSTRLPFRACQIRSCTNVTIINDRSREPLMEQFSVSLKTVQEGPRIRVNPEPSRIVILDNDGMLW